MYFLESNLILYCMSTQISTRLFLVSSSLISIMLIKCVLAVLLSASYGHGKNQSIVVQLTKVGNVLSLLLKESPTGENTNTICRFFLH